MSVDQAIGLGEPQRVGRFRYYLTEQRWERSDAVARMHGYQAGTVTPTTELLLQHKHPDDRGSLLTHGAVALRPPPQIYGTVRNNRRAPQKSLNQAVVQQLYVRTQ